MRFASFTPLSAKRATSMRFPIKFANVSQTLEERFPSLGVFWRRQHPSLAALSNLL